MSGAGKCHQCGKPVKDCPGHEVKNKCHQCGKPVKDCPGH
jgi:NAD-dependent dihydropyrimidine dehydrogenase PreA subunit